MGARAHRIASLAAVFVLTVALSQSVGVAFARHSAAIRTVLYHGYAVRVPGSWPVYRLDQDPHVCVRFNRHALYLGDPGSGERCPPHTAGRTEAILIEPIAAVARLGTRNTALAPSGRETRFVVPSRGVVVTATWSHHPTAVARALGRRSLPPPTRSTAPPPSAAGARAAQVRAHAATVYTGLGFDACNAPSPAAMSAWGSSPYRALGIYIGGTNSACAQPNLTAQWVSSEVAAGWHLIPTYVGLQAPSNSCGCAAINSGQAAAEGTAAATDAVVQAQAIGIPAGNPIYYDMEAYGRTTANTSAVLAFLSAWTSQLHADGYTSGVYGGASSGITDLVAARGTSVVEPDDIWIAEWNGQQSTSSGYVPASDWSGHQRLHQYQGGHDETYGGVTINIDSDYLDGATAGSGPPPGPPPPPPPPALAVSSAPDGTTSLSLSWAGSGAAASWQVLAGLAPSALTPITATPVRGSKTQIAIRDAAPYFAANAIGAGGQVLASSATVATPPHVAIYGHSAFVPPGNALAGLPAGCYTNTPCHVATTLSVGRTVIARTGPENLGSNSAGMLYFKLTSRGRTMLSRGRRLLTRVNARDASGAAATATVNLIPFATSGHTPRRSVKQAPPLQIIGTTDFVSSGGVGGILAGCFAASPCFVRTTISIGRTAIASTGPEFIGGDELGYLIFSLTARGRALLAHAGGNQLGARLAITTGGATATAQIALDGFS